MIQICSLGGGVASSALFLMSLHLKTLPMLLCFQILVMNANPRWIHMPLQRLCEAVCVPVHIVKNVNLE